MKKTRNLGKGAGAKAPMKMPVKPMSESGAGSGTKGRRDSAPVNSRDGKKAVASANDFGGELIIEGKLLPELKAEILAIARNTGKTGPRDGERVTKIDDKGDKLTLRTSGADLAVSIGKRVHHSHKGGKLTIVWGSDEAPVRVHWTKK